jgi:hypothetical protein
MSTRVTCPDADALVSYLYGEFEPAAGPTRQEMARHLAECATCASEIAALGGVREQLAAWTTPEVDLGFRLIQTPPRRSPRGIRAWAASAVPAHVRTAVPMAAAAVLVLGAGLGLARLDVQYDASGLRIRTGWGHDAPLAGATAQSASAPSVSTTSPAATSGVPKPSSSQDAAAQAAITRADLVAFETRLRRELASSVAATNVAADSSPTLSPAVQAALLKHVRQLIDDSEVRQQQNLQLRVSEMSRDFQLRRQADLVQIEQGFGRIAGDNAQQRQMIKEYLRNVSTTPARPQP